MRRDARGGRQVQTREGFKGGMPLLLNALQKNDERIDGGIDATEAG
jgi:hypothetical protein